MSKKKMTLKEFSKRYECCYSAAGVRLKKLIAKDKKFAKHVSRKGRTYLLDEYAAELLKPKSTKRASVSSSDIEKLKELNDAPFLAGHSTTIFSTKFY